MDEWPMLGSEVRECEQCRTIRNVRLLADPCGRAGAEWYCLICYMQAQERATNASEDL
jgi:hypothetical protein